MQMLHSCSNKLQGAMSTPCSFLQAGTFVLFFVVWPCSFLRGGISPHLQYGILEFRTYSMELLLNSSIFFLSFALAMMIDSSRVHFLLLLILIFFCQTWLLFCPL
jgi:hypothetical protein